MASRQQFKEDRAEAAAKLAAKDIGDINRANERDEGYNLNSEVNFKQARAEAASKLAAKDLEDVNRLRQSAWSENREHRDENKPGVLGSMFRAAKEAVVGTAEKAKETTDAAGSKVGEYADYASQKAKETKDATKDKAGEYADYATQKTKEAKDVTMDKAGEYKDYAADKANEAKDTTMQKTGEYKDYTAEKAKEGKDSAVGKLGELKDKAMGFFTGKKDDIKETDYGMGGGREKLVIRMEESRPGAVADALKVAGKAMGDAEEEGVLHVERRREKM